MRTAAPPLTGNSRIPLGARFPYSAPGSTETLFCDAHAIQRPWDAQAQECRSGPVAIVRPPPPSAGMAESVSPRTNAISRPSGDQIADWTMLFVPGGIRGCDEPPSAGATDAPPRVRNRILVPSGDHRGCVSSATESSERGIGRPPVLPTGRMKIRIRVPLPAAYAISLPSGDSAGWISSPGSDVIWSERPTLSAGLDGRSINAAPTPASTSTPP